MGCRSRKKSFAGIGIYIDVCRRWPFIRGAFLLLLLLLLYTQLLAERTSASVISTPLSFAYVHASALSISRETTIRRYTRGYTQTQKRRPRISHDRDRGARCIFNFAIVFSRRAATSNTAAPSLFLESRFSHKDCSAWLQPSIFLLM